MPRTCASRRTTATRRRRSRRRCRSSRSRAWRRGIPRTRRNSNRRIGANGPRGGRGTWRTPPNGSWARPTRCPSPPSWRRTAPDARRRSTPSWRSSTCAAPTRCASSGRHDVDVDVGTLTQAGVVLVVDDAHLLPAAPREALRVVAGASDTGLVIAIAPSPPGGDDPLVAAIVCAGSVVRPGPLGADDVAVRVERLLEARPIPRSSSSCSPAPAATPASPTGSSACGGDAGSIEQGALHAEPEMTPAEVADLVTALAAELSPGPQAALTALSIGPCSTTSSSSRSATFLSTPPPRSWHELRAAGFLVPDHEEPLPIVADAVATRCRCCNASRPAPADRGPAGRARRSTGPDRRSPRRRRRAGHRRRGTCSRPRVRLRSRRHRASPRTSSVEPSPPASTRARSRVRAPRRLRSPATRTLRSRSPTARSAARSSRRPGPSSCSWRARSPWSVGAGTPLVRRDLGAPATPGGRGAGARHGRRGRARSPRARRRAVTGRRRGPARGDRGRRRPVPGPRGASRRGRGRRGGAPVRGGGRRPPRECRRTGRAPGDAPRARRARSRIATGDSEDAERMAGRGADAEIGGPAALRRHRLLGGFAAMRAGRWDRAQQAARRGAGPCTTRDDLLRGALAARGGAPMPVTWRDWSRPGTRSRRALGAVHGDLFLLLPLTELVVVSARLGRRDATAPREAELDEVLDGLGRPGLWARPLAWARVEAAVAADDADGLGRRHDGARRRARRARPPRRDSTPRRGRGSTCSQAAPTISKRASPGSSARAWSGRRRGSSDRRRSGPRTRARRGRCSVARRELKGTLLVLDEAGVPTGTVLSTREQEVAACVVDGLTHKEIGAHALHLAEDRRAPRRAHPPEAGCHEPRRAARGPSLDAGSGGLATLRPSGGPACTAAGVNVPPCPRRRLRRVRESPSPRRSRRHGRRLAAGSRRFPRSSGAASARTCSGRSSSSPCSPARSSCTPRSPREPTRRSACTGTPRSASTSAASSSRTRRRSRTRPAARARRAALPRRRPHPHPPAHGGRGGRQRDRRAGSSSTAAGRSSEEHLALSVGRPRRAQRRAVPGRPGRDGPLERERRGADGEPGRLRTPRTRT